MKLQVTVAGVLKDIPVSQLTKKANGDYERYYNADMTLDIATIAKDIIQKMIAKGEAVVEKYVQAEVDKYNEANNVMFSSVYNCSVYTEQDSYPHQQFCKDIVAFNAKVWEEARAVQQAGVSLDMTAAEFVSMLPIFNEAG